MRKCDGSVMLWRTFCWCEWDPVVSLEGRFTAHQSKVLLFSSTFILQWNISIPMKVLWWQRSRHGERGSLKGLMCVKIVSFGLRSQQISIQLDTYERFWTNILDSTFPIITKTLNDKIHFARTVFIPPDHFQTFSGESGPGHNKGIIKLFFNLHTLKMSQLKRISAYFKKCTAIANTDILYIRHITMSWRQPE